MYRVLTLTTDLPYFPGKNGHDFFNLRHLAATHRLGLVAPYYDRYPAAGVANLEAFLSQAHFWPRPTGPLTLFASEEYSGRIPGWIQSMPASWRSRILEHLTGIRGLPADAHEKLAILSNLAPHLLKALLSGPWDAIVLIQTNIAHWLDYLPSGGGKLIYFHDVRSDYLSRAIPVPGELPLSKGEIEAVRRQERGAIDRADVAAFVSELDLERARRIFGLPESAGVAPIPIDTEYYGLPSPDRVRDPRPAVLFTGHLSHPPNVDAALYFLAEIWPRIRERLPEAVFRAVGLLPATALKDAVAAAPGCELHANVPDIRPYFWDASVYVVPMRFGGGVRQKLFESWSMGVPVVCTSMAAEGTGAIGGTHCWLEDEPETFAARVVSLLRDRGAAEMIRKAKAYVESRNSIAAAAPRFQALVERAAAIKRRKPFKLLFDLRWMEIGRAGGIEQATYELLDSIGRLDHRNEYRLFAPGSTLSEWRFPDGFRFRAHRSDAVERRLEALKAFVGNRMANGLGRHPVMTPTMRTLAAFRKLDFDLVHSTCGYIHPDLVGFPGVLTVNDLQHLHHPAFFTPQEREERERLYRASVEAARHIICISEFTRQDLHRQYGVPLERMTTVWIIPSRTVWTSLESGVRAGVLARMGVSGRFLLFPAHCWPHKNHAALVEALVRVESELPADVSLVLTGRPFPEDHPAAAKLRGWKGAARVRHLGFRSPLEMKALFQGCTALVFPSLFEGFGMPVAEAIIAGRPVLCSNVTSLPEIAGEAALTFDPNDPDEIGRRILDVVLDPERERALAQAAIARRPRFSARRSTLQTLSVYHQVYEQIHGK